MKVLVTGSHGLIGTALVAALRDGGHSVTRLVRGEPAGTDKVSWDPVAGTIDRSGLEGHDAAVNLAGAGIGDHRWTAEHKALVRDSRVRATSLLAEAIAGLDSPPRTLLSGSAVGIYGDRGDQELTEAADRGEGFLASVVKEWEGATARASEAGIRVAHLRTGVVLSARGGALRKQLTPFRLGLGGRIGTGRQHLSWISLDDEVGAIVHLLEAESVAGPVNLTAPNPVTNAEFTRALGSVLHRPTVLPVPTVALHALFGREMTAEMLLGGQRVLPTVLIASGFQFRYPDLVAALAHELS
jgi:uncharacterized protein (TIGR01777 family)